MATSNNLQEWLWVSQTGNRITSGLRFWPELNQYVEPRALVGSMVFYLAMVAVLRWYMGDERKALQLNTVMRIYNVCQVVLCGWMTAGLLQNLLQAPTVPAQFLGINLPNIFATSMPLTAEVEWIVFVHFLSKFLDFFDTFFIALRRKESQLSFLHMYHHATIGPIWGLLLWLGFGSGTALFGALVNSFIHTLMYSHYLFTSYGFKNPLKRYLTMAQICQFYACIAHAVFVIVIPFEREYIRGLAVLQVAYHISMVVLFSSFFVKIYGTAKTQSVAVSKKAE